MPKIRFAIPPLIVVFTIVTFFFGGYWLWTGFLLVTMVPRFIDHILGDDTVPDNGPAWAAQVSHFAVIPGFMLLALMYLYYLNGTGMRWLEIPAGWIGANLGAARSNTGLAGLIGGVLTIGLIYSATVLPVSHELIHRLRQPFSQ